MRDRLERIKVHFHGAYSSSGLTYYGDRREATICSNCPQGVLFSVPKDTANSQEQELGLSNFSPRAEQTQFPVLLETSGRRVADWQRRVQLLQIFLGPTAQSLLTEGKMQGVGGSLLYWRAHS